MAYINDVSKLAQYCQTMFPDVQLRDIQVEHLRQYIVNIGANIMNTRSQTRWMSGLKSFFTFLKLENACSFNPIEDMDYPHLARNIPEVLSVEEIESIISTIDLSLPLGIRNRAIIEILYGCGLRVSELVALKLSDIFWEEDMIRVIGKGNKQRFIPMGQSAKKALNNYIQYERSLANPDKHSTDIAFLNRRGKKLTREMIFIMIQKIAKQAGIDKHLGPHTFRHSFATHMVQRGADLRSVQAMLGHESIVTTEIYTHLDRDYLRQMLVDYHPLSHLNKH